MAILSEIYDSEAIGTCLRPLRRVSVLPATESSLTVSKYSSQKTKRGDMQGELSTKILGVARASLVSTCRHVSSRRLKKRRD
jgi:hypothetical protein